MPPFIVTCHYHADKFLRCAVEAPTRQAAENEVRLALSTDSAAEDPPFDIRVLNASYTLKNMRTEVPKGVHTPVNGVASHTSPPPPRTPLEVVYDAWRVLEPAEIVRLLTELTPSRVRQQIVEALYAELIDRAAFQLGLSRPDSSELEGQASA
jgi:hypothetical protein